MKPLIVYIGMLTVCCSCSTYQYITLSSPDLTQNEKHQFVAENDTLKLTYDFNGYTGPIKITVFNKLDRPLLMDMNRSALVSNDKAIGFNSGKVELSGTAVSFAHYRAADINLSGTLPPGIVFIPSGSYVTKTPYAVADNLFTNIPDKQFKEEKYRTPDNFSFKMKTASFTKESSPMIFRTYITFVEQGPDKKEITRQHIFYVSEVRQTQAAPINLSLPYAGNQFYTFGAYQDNTAGNTSPGNINRGGKPASSTQ